MTEMGTEVKTEVWTKVGQSGDLRRMEGESRGPRENQKESEREPSGIGGPRRGTPGKPMGDQGVTEVL